MKYIRERFKNCCAYYNMRFWSVILNLIWWLNVLWYGSYHVIRCAVPIFWWSIISHVVHHHGGNKISHRLKKRPWTSFKVRNTLQREVAVWVTVVSFLFYICTGYIEDIKSGKEKFESLASQISDCSSAKNGGDLGLFGRGTHSYTQLLVHLFRTVTLT